MEFIWAQLVSIVDSMGWWLVAGSVAMLVVSFAAMPLIVARIPEDYFTHHARHRMRRNDHHIISLLLLACVKNVMGAILVLAGVVMLFTPGQGLLAILLGLMIMNYPGKYQFEGWIISRPLIFDAVNRLRARAGKAPLQKPE